MEDGIALRLLGPVTLRAGQAWISPGPPQQRLILAVLSLSAGRVVSASELIDAVWGENLPRSVRGSLHALVTHVRQPVAGIPGAGLDRYGDGYRLRLDAGRVDLHRFRALARAGRDTADGPPAIARFDQALALWRGPALADVADSATAELLRSGLADEHLAVTADRIAALLRCRREREAAAELPSLLAAHPMAERLAAMLMVARYRCGQRAEALQVFRDIRDRLSAQLGVEPGGELQRLHRLILAGDGLLDGAVAQWGPADPEQCERGHGPLRLVGRSGVAGAVPRQLPSAAAHFVARADELTLLDDLVEAGGAQAGEAEAAASVWVISGTAGVGKTALALRWAHQAAANFPDGQLYVNLMGFSPSGPAAPEQAIRGFLQALGVPQWEIPDSADAQAALYRSVLAGRRMLVLLDNALDAHQVRPLLPGCRGCAVLITSRSQLTGLVAAEGARLLNLDVLDEPDARELLARRLGEPRVAAEPEAAAELAGLCARLPLALTVAAARAAVHPSLALADVAAELRRETAPLDALELGDPASSVREVFSWSCRHLSNPARQMFRLLGIHPGRDISAGAAASLAGLPEPEARQALGELDRVHLMTQWEPGRYCCHDLLRAYAAEQAGRYDQAGLDAAARRVLDHYVHTAAAASRLLYPASDPPAPGPAASGAVPLRLAGRAQALAWFSAEREVVLAAARHSAGAGFETHAWQLTAAATEFLNRQGHWRDLAAAAATALDAARRLDDRDGEAHADYSLGIACLGLGRGREGRARLERAVDLYRKLGDTTRQARGVLAVGEVLRQQGRHAAARRQAEQALRLYTRIGHRAGRARALTNLGWHITQLGEYPDALIHCEQALDLHREIGNLLGEAHTWDHLGYARHQMGRSADAITCYRRALRLLRQVTDRLEQAGVLARLGDAHTAVGNRGAARDAWHRSLAILDELHHPSAAQVRSRMQCSAVPGGTGRPRAALRQL